MMDPMKGLSPPLAGVIDRVQGPKGPNIKDQPGIDPASSHADVFDRSLEQALQGQAQDSQALRFSQHARQRIHSRSIDLSPQDFLKMQEAVQRARDKGSRQSLILTDSAAFVVSVKNNTVITAVDKESLKENVFTNIDSTIMI